MTEEYWQSFKRNKERSENWLFSQAESDLKRKFKNEKSPEEMYSICSVDNNYWKQYRSSERLDPDAVALSLCKSVGCDLMFCQAVTASKKNVEYFCN